MVLNKKNHFGRSPDFAELKAKVAQRLKMNPFEWLCGIYV